MADSTEPAPETDHADHAGWHRCFVALVPDAASREALAALPIDVGVRRVPADQLHMTLAFLGSIAESKGRALAAALPAAVVPLPALAPRRLAYWPHPGRARLAALDFEPADELAVLEARVRALIVDLGLPIDDHRPFRPHVTLARMSRNAKAAGAHRTAREDVSFDGAEAFRFDMLTLYSSTLARGGARYRSLASVPVPAR
ncbi:RNA 2',3'-cyclic phosphodiesterase [Trinickia caryophylli]|uniref:RNA 2',3'-cyclic phosphodiesterase n=1 Tax=Trinickia caryophylli TaxID=28094 RepID=A0A1X7F4S1_TRICW|nr:RNA 2',3'-cyclic phosphodiesterase [Trinickia caryophylli]PMS08686.1 RNA 2',3'-cyclic phosphodiesterase [Trinickia caryophylli]TRX19430.1 RNA 2',3'-cyclic phosphodiesterase [Trinickia caryophylli]WQE13265.1 RNA 2',3'-cyclic phosphodiesterase [Trinickia caryophylli]SMF45791.1 2'-5' RNA ligase [Trinickia caryophylli]GLU34416.1 RNA 2',3'-cyclic phosphodiesterase [Trinickia caryophylli]